MRVFDQLCHPSTYGVHPAFRLAEDDYCQECGVCVGVEDDDENDGEKAFRDECGDVWCCDCLIDWHGSDKVSDAETLLRLHLGGPGCCVDCGELLAYGYLFFEVYGPDRAYCEECTDKRAAWRPQRAC